jgi:hypothetical protein
LKPWGMLMGDETTYTKQSRLYRKLQKISIKQSAKLHRKPMRFFQKKMSKPS